MSYLLKIVTDLTKYIGTNQKALLVKPHDQMISKHQFTDKSNDMKFCTKNRSCMLISSFYIRVVCLQILMNLIRYGFYFIFFNNFCIKMSRYLHCTVIVDTFKHFHSKIIPFKMYCHFERM